MLFILPLEAVQYGSEKRLQACKAVLRSGKRDYGGMVLAGNICLYRFVIHAVRSTAVRQLVGIVPVHGNLLIVDPAISCDGLFEARLLLAQYEKLWRRIVGDILKLRRSGSAIEGELVASGRTFRLKLPRLREFDGIKVLGEVPVVVDVECGVFLGNDGLLRSGF